MKVLKVDTQNSKKEDLNRMDSESTMLLESLAGGVRVVGGMLQAVDRKYISDEDLKDLGGLMVAAGHIINEMTSTKDTINAVNDSANDD